MAIAIHAFVDGWGLVAVQAGTHTPGSRTVFAAALMLHKIPEGLALGTMREHRWIARRPRFALCAAVELATVAGGCYGILADARSLGDYPLAIAGGTFCSLEFTRSMGYGSAEARGPPSYPR